MKTFKYLVFCALIFSAVACGNSTRTNQTNEEPIVHVLHEQDIAALSPDSVIAILKRGNEDFVHHLNHNRDAVAQLKESSTDGQHPLAIVLSCIDARVPVELIFDKGVGDLFVTRIAGNVVSPDVLGSMEYACEHSGAKLVVVMGHKQCGAVHSACEGVHAGNMTQMLAKLDTAIYAAKTELGDSVHGAEFENAVVRENVEISIEKIRQHSEILAHLEAEGKIKIVGAIFSLDTGEVQFL